MYLKRLEIQGFKSFADKVELDFNPGITVVVGPNGSGKSNIVDAIRWVLGEQSAKNLRGLRMDDIIFSGSDGRRPVGMAQVSLTIDNSTGIFPLDFNEVTVTRRLYRSGESEYLINKVICRMKDIHELFMDTGVGKEGFSVIGQGKIDEMLSLKAEERRNLIEEAAGIVKYRYRKKEAQRKLDDTEQSMLRINDIISELREQLGPLEDQANKARQYQSWKEEADGWEISLTLQNILDCQEKKEKTEELLDELEKQVTQDTTASHQLNAQLEEIRSDLQELEQQLTNLQQIFYNTSRELEKHGHQIEVAKERKAGFTAQVLRLRSNTDDLDIAEQKLKTQLEGYQREVNTITGQYRQIKGVIDQLATTLHSNKSQLEQNGHLIDEHKTVLIDLLQEKAKTNNEINRLGHELIANKKRTENIADKVLKVDTLLNGERTALSQKVQEKEQLVVAKATLEGTIAKLNSSLADNQKQQQQIKINYEKQKEDYQQSKSHLKVLAGMEEAGEGYQKGVKAILDIKKSNPFYRQGILGTVADIISVPPHLETAIETALGGSLQYLVAENDEVAQRAINYLKAEKKGRATFLPLNTINVRYFDEKLEGEQVLGRASELVEYDLKYKKAVEFLLGRIWVIGDLAHGVALGKKAKFSSRMVTLDGELITPGGALTGGSFSKNKAGLLARKRVINELGEKITLTEQKLKDIGKELNLLEQQEGQLNQGIAGAKEELHNLTIKISQVDGLKVQINKEITRLNSEKELHIFDQGQLQEEDARCQNELLTLKEKLLQLSEEQHRMEGSIEEVESSKKELAAAQEKIAEDLNREKISLATLEQNKINANLRYQEALERLAEITKEKEKILAEDTTLKEEIVGLDLLIIESQDKVKEYHFKLEKDQEQLQEAKEKRIYLQQEIVRLEKEVKDRLLQLEQKKEQKHQEQLSITKLAVELENNETKLREQFDCTVERALELKREITNRRNVVRRINELRALIGELGLVNFAAIHEFERVGSRLEFLEKQIFDLEEAKITLSKVIKEMDQIMVKRFKETFNLVNMSFSKIFGQLFGGGKAFLQLTDGENLLETGIEIIAQPPGKKPQSLSLLSGGERAMTAIALLLAILEIKPSPFCVLDEIEAALDEANVVKFAQYLKNFSGKTQFIIISHRKGTMEIGDFLYGVTIEANGVSKLISVKLSEAI